MDMSMWSTAKRHATTVVEKTEQMKSVIKALQVPYNSDPEQAEEIMLFLADNLGYIVNEAHDVLHFIESMKGEIS